MTSKICYKFYFIECFLVSNKYFYFRAPVTANVILVVQPICGSTAVLRETAKRRPFIIVLQFYRECFTTVHIPTLLKDICLILDTHTINVI